MATPVSTAAHCSVLSRRASPAAVLEPNPATLISATNLAIDLRALGERKWVRQIKDWLRAPRGS